jgi:hypothetical protein
MSQKEPNKMRAKNVIVVGTIWSVGLLMTLGLSPAVAQAVGPCAVCGHVPELDLRTVGGAVTVFGAGVALLLERYRRRKP